MTASDMISLAALVVSLLALWFGGVHPWWERRHRSGLASLEARVEEYVRADGERDHLSSRIVVTNHGPAAARDVAVANLRGPDGEPIRDVVQFNWHLPIPALQPGQEYHLALAPTLSDHDPSWMTIVWTDATGPHEEDRYVSTHHVLG